jgi:hypothetical protein
MTPFSAVTVWVEVRAELVGGPIWDTPKTAITTSATARRYRCHGRRRGSAMTHLPPVAAGTAGVTKGLGRHRCLLSEVDCLTTDTFVAPDEWEMRAAAPARS